MRKLQPDFQERLDVMLSRMSGFKDTDEPVNANCMFAAFSNGKKIVRSMCKEEVDVQSTRHDADTCFWRMFPQTW